MTTLKPNLRRDLENVVKEAREVAEKGARAALEALTVPDAKRGGHVDGDAATLRNRLRAHAKQLGDPRSAKGEQEIDRLIGECAYEHWHRMLFARFLAENDLLIEPQSEVAVALEDVEQLAEEEGADLWEMAASFATKMLPQIFRVDNPVLAIDFPKESRLRLEELLESLPAEVFEASDSLGWVYQFWQTNEKKRINESEVKIGARELPAVTQLFTEPYMVSFLLDNSLGAWWAARRLTEEDFRTAESEQELREKAALPGVPLEYLRFVRTNETTLPPGGSDAVAAGEGSSSDDNPSEPTGGPWTPAAGTFDAWPESLSELKTLDPCCGSGHFLVAALLMLTPMRMELEGLSATEAVDRVLSENLHGLEIDQRCVELAAFALALAAWRFPASGGYRTLPDLNVACCGLSVSVAKEEWKELAHGNNELKIALDWMYDEFKDAPYLGTLLNPQKNSLPVGTEWSDIQPALKQALSAEREEEQLEATVVAHGLSRTAVLLSSRFDYIITNVPYKKTGELDEIIQKHIEQNFKPGKKGLETAFLLRCLELCSDNATIAAVAPQNWTFQITYKKFRQEVLKGTTFQSLARLGPSAFEEISGEIVKAILIILDKAPSIADTNFFSIDTSAESLASEKAKRLTADVPKYHSQKAQLDAPDSRISIDEVADDDLLSEVAESGTGIQTFDSPRFLSCFWEQYEIDSKVYVGCQTTVEEIQEFGGRSQMLRWQGGLGDLFLMMKAKEELENYRSAIWKGWSKYLGRKGICVSLMGGLPVSFFDGVSFDNNTAVLIPKDSDNLAPLWAFCESRDFHLTVRTIDQALKVTGGTLEKIPFDLAHWQEVASEKYLHGLPEPYSDDPTQWLFHGHPGSSTDALQVAVARLLGYRWPAELDDEMELATDARAWIERSGELNAMPSLVDEDGIVCMPAVVNEDPAAGRLLNLLSRAYEQGTAQEQAFQEKLQLADQNDPVTVDLWRRDWKPVLPDNFTAWRDEILEHAGHAGKTLESWLRDKFFDQHCKLFHNRPFIWHIWDGCKDGFAALVNYHRLAGPNGRRVLEKLTHSYLGDWIKRQEDDQKRGAGGADKRLIAARALKSQLEAILKGEPPYDIFVRWKPLHEQPIGWEPDLNDGVRMNIRPFMATDIDGARKGSGILRHKPNINWKKDRGKEVEKPKADFPWHWSWDEETIDFAGGEAFDKNRWNDCHYTNAHKQAARDAHENQTVDT